MTERMEMKSNLMKWGTILVACLTAVLIGNLIRRAINVARSIAVTNCMDLHWAASTDPDEALEATHAWCDGFVDNGGRR